MACCCQPCYTTKAAASCLGRCTLPKHSCLSCAEMKGGCPVPKCMGWKYTAKNSPKHQLRCGWRPGHVACPVLRKIEAHNGSRTGSCCSPAPCVKSACISCCSTKPCPGIKCDKTPSTCPTVCLPGPCCKPTPCGQPLIRIIRHGGQYTICTKPSNINTSPAGPYPLKYVLNPDPLPDDHKVKAKYSVEAKFNDYRFDYASSQESFVIDFTPPEQKCFKRICVVPC